MTENTSARRFPTWSWLGVLVAVALVLALAAFAVHRLWVRPDLDALGRERADEVAASTAATRFVAQLLNYDAEGDLDAYVETLKGMLTTKQRSDFEAAQEINTQLIEKGGVVAQGQVLTYGLASLDQDSATVLVVADQRATNELEESPVQRHYRWQVKLRKVGGTWLVDDFDTVPPSQRPAG